MGNKLNKQKRRDCEISMSPYCHCPELECPEGLTLDELLAWSADNINNDPIIGYEDITAPEYYGGHTSNWAVRRCLACGKTYSDCPGWA